MYAKCLLLFGSRHFGKRFFSLNFNKQLIIRILYNSQNKVLVNDIESFFQEKAPIFLTSSSKFSLSRALPLTLLL